MAIDESCRDEPDSTIFSATIEWRIDSFEDFPEYIKFHSPPMVGLLTDDNSDGLIDDNDIPDIVLIGGIGGGGIDVSQC